jgi:hypothetical protein
MVGDGSVKPTASFDLHLGNVMQIKDGTPVITDPLVSYADDDGDKGVSAAKSPAGTNTLKKMLKPKNFVPAGTAPEVDRNRRSVTTTPWVPEPEFSDRYRDRRVGLYTMKAQSKPDDNDIAAAYDRGHIGTGTAKSLWFKNRPNRTPLSQAMKVFWMKKNFGHLDHPQTPLPKTADVLKAKKAGVIGTATEIGIFAKKDGVKLAFGDGTKTRIINRLKALKEEAPVNSVGTGNIAGLGVGPKGEPGRNPSLMPMVRRSKNFAGKAVFSVTPKLYDEARLEKRKYQRWTKYLEEDAYDELAPIREYANANPTKPIIIENEMTGAMCYIKYGKE